MKFLCGKSQQDRLRLVVPEKSPCVHTAKAPCLAFCEGALSERVLISLLQFT